MSFNNTNKLGSNGESLAKKYLQDLNYEILELNYCNCSGRRIGEIDIVAKKDDMIIFVEVKSKVLKNYSQSPAEESINWLKLRKLNKIANFYISKNNLWNKSFRFDAVTVYFREIGGEPIIKHIESIFL